MNRYMSLLVVSMVAAALACGEKQSEEEIAAQRVAARADSVAAAEARYDAAVFDTVTWENEESRMQRGLLVWNSSCVKCHGQNGGGNGDLAMQAGYKVPSFMVTDWQYAGDVDALRRRVFVGYSGEMPNWGLVGLKYRDVDAVAGYIAGNLGPQPAQN